MKETGEQNDAATFDTEDDLREVKYQYHSFFSKIFYLHVWPRLNYFWLHISYILGSLLIGGLIIYKIEQGNPTYANGDRPPLTYIDCALSAATAASATGMGTLDFWALRNGSKVVHLVLTQLGSIVFVGAATAFIRWISLSNWLRKHPARAYRAENDSLILCHSALLRLGCAMAAFNVFVVAVASSLLAIYASVALHDTLSKYDNTNPTWFAFFTVTCGFNQAGFGVIHDGLIPFNHDLFVVVLLSIVILCSNPFLPLVMRGIINTCAKFSKNPAPWKFLLEHPRICSTILFPSIQTRMLSGFVCLFLIAGMLSFSLLDYNYPVLSGLSGWNQFLVTVFQATNTIQAGYPVVQVNDTNPAQQWCYFIYMLVAVYPYVSMLRNTEIITEGKDFFHPDSLIKQSQRDDAFGRRMTQGSRMARANIVLNTSVHHLKKTFLGDAFWLILAVFLICVFDGKAIETDAEFSLWKVLFEVAGAYGGVGLTLGYPMMDGGFAKIFSQRAKIVLIGVLILGRHRGMPRSKDIAVMQVQMLVKNHPIEEDPPSLASSVN